MRVLVVSGGHRHAGRSEAGQQDFLRDSIWYGRERKESRMTPGFGSKNWVKSGIYGYGKQ